MTDQLIRYFRENLSPPLEVVDVGASDLWPDNPPSYRTLLRNGLANLTGFEPNQEELKKLKQTESERYLPYAIGNGDTTQLYLTQAPGFSSVLKPKSQFVDHIARFREQTKVVNTIEIEATRLDDIPEVSRIDWLKIDIQGGEIAAFKGGYKKLQNCLCIQTEVAFSQIYIDQPTFADQSKLLDDLGFEFFGFQGVSAFSHRSGIGSLNRRTLRREFKQHVDADAIFIPKYERLAELSKQELLGLIAIMLLGYRAASFALHLCDLQETDRLNLAQLRRLISTQSLY